MTSHINFGGPTYGDIMELSPKQQIAELIKKNQKILVIGHKNHGGDLLGSMLALERVLLSLGKEVEIVLSETVDQTLLFLPGVEKIKKDITARDLIIQIDKTKNDVDKIGYNEENGIINIVITPKRQLLTAKDLSITTGNYHYDLIIVLDTADVEKIDSIYDKYTELFFEVPIINIDHHSGNEYFGTVNLVDMTATSTAEILVSIIEAMGPSYFDADVATCLLTGLIADTASFKNTNTSPKSLTISAQMLAAGARQQEIIQNLYKTRPLQTLKLWGKVLSNIQYDNAHRMLVSYVSEADLQDANAAPESVNAVLEELLASAPGTDVVLVLAEAKNRLYGYLKGLNGQDVLGLAENFGGHGNALTAEFVVPNATLKSHKETVLSKLKALRDLQLGKEVIPLAKTSEPVAPLGDNTKTTFAADIDKARIDYSSDNLDDENALESIEKVLESEELPDNEPSYEEMFIAVAPGSGNISVEGAMVKGDSDDIEKALQSIDNEIETGGVQVNENTPNIDVEDVKDKKEALRQLGDVMRGYTPGKALDEKGNQPIDAKIWK